MAIAVSAPGLEFTEVAEFPGNACGGVVNRSGAADQFPSRESALPPGKCFP